MITLTIFYEEYVFYDRAALQSLGRPAGETVPHSVLHRSIASLVPKRWLSLLGSRCKSRSRHMVV